MAYIKRKNSKKRYSKKRYSMKRYSKKRNSKKRYSKKRYYKKYSKKRYQKGGGANVGFTLVKSHDDIPENTPLDLKYHKRVGAAGGIIYHNLDTGDNVEEEDVPNNAYVVDLTSS